MGVTDETFVYRNEITRLKQEREGHLAHIALLKASLKQAGQETDAALERPGA